MLLAWAGFLTTGQLTEAVGYPTIRRAQRRLRVLLDQGLARVELQSDALHLPSLHAPTRKAVERLVEDGSIDSHHSMPRIPRPQKRAHALLLREVFATFAAAEARGLLRLDDFQFDSDLCRAEPFRGSGLIPDGIATVVAGTGVATIAIEADTGSETTTTLRKKFAKWRAILDIWNPPALTLLVVAEREGRRQTLARIMSEARVDGVGIAVLIADVRGFVSSLGAPDDPAARVSRTERRTRVVEVRGVAENSAPVEAAFRVLVR